jgi:mutator protein MutT
MPMKQVNVAIAIVTRGREILICQRKSDATLADFWEFPGGKIEPGETPAQCASREVLEEVGLVVETVESMPLIEFDYADARVRLHPFFCNHLGGEPLPIGCQQTRWVAPESLGDYRFPPANDSLLREIQSRFKQATR